jgi:hypothetical protein
MFFFKKGQEAELTDLVKRHRADHQKLEALLQEFRSLEPRWSELQAHAEILAARYQAQDYCYAQGVSEEFWKEAGPRLKAELVAAVDERDALTANLVEQIGVVKARIAQRLSLVAGAFNSWAGQLPPAIAAELAETRQEIRDSGDLPKIVQAIQSAARKVVESDEGSSTIVLPSWGSVIAQAHKRGL